MASIVCFGEILLRLSAHAGEQLLQSPGLETCIGGAEANVAVALSRFGHEAAVVSSLPDNALGFAARDAVRAHGVDTRSIQFRAGRMGLYFLTPGAMLRPAEIIYDRAGSAFAQNDAYDWPALLAGAGWLHVSGISPAVGPRPAAAVLAAMKAARAAGVRISFDGNYRASLWAQQGSDGADVLHELLAHADLAFADQRDVALVLRRPELAGDRAAAMQAAFAAFPQLQRVAATVRTQHSADHHELTATLYTRSGVLAGRSFPLQGIVERIGTGDAFAAGVLHGLLSGWDDADALDFGLAAGVLKHSLAGDFSPVNQAQVHAIASGGLDVRR
jgi:2-dehydro-3-deoxygluconokinase